MRMLSTLIFVFCATPCAITHTAESAQQYEEKEIGALQFVFLPTHQLSDCPIALQKEQFQALSQAAVDLLVRAQHHSAQSALWLRASRILFLSAGRVIFSPLLHQQRELMPAKHQQESWTVRVTTEEDPEPNQQHVITLRAPTSRQSLIARQWSGDTHSFDLIRANLLYQLQVYVYDHPGRRQQYLHCLDHHFYYDYLLMSLIVPPSLVAFACVGSPLSVAVNKICTAVLGAAVPQKLAWPTVRKLLERQYDRSLVHELDYATHAAYPIRRGETINMASRLLFLALMYQVEKTEKDQKSAAALRAMPLHKKVSHRIRAIYDHLCLSIPTPDCRAQNVIAYHLQQLPPIQRAAYKEQLKARATVFALAMTSLTCDDNILTPIHRLIDEVTPYTPNHMCGIL